MYSQILQKSFSLTSCDIGAVELHVLDAIFQNAERSKPIGNYEFRDKLEYICDSRITERVVLTSMTLAGTDYQRI